MKILLTGANGYIGQRLLPVLCEKGHQVVCLVRSQLRLDVPHHIQSQVSSVAADLLQSIPDSLLPKDIDVAYYLVHSMGQQAKGFYDQEALSAKNFADAIKKTNCKQIVYLSGLAHGEKLSEHMSSRHNVETILQSSGVPITILQAGIIIGSGSASFEIIRDLVEKLPVMVAPKWISSKCQPLAVADVIHYLTACLLNPLCLNKTLELGGPEVLTYKQMLKTFAKVRGLRRLIITVPVLTPRLSSYWLFFVTNTTFALARALVDSLKTDAVQANKDVDVAMPHVCIPYEDALKRAFQKIEQNAVISSWKDAMVRSELVPNLMSYVTVPTFGCFTYEARRPVYRVAIAKDKLWKIGGKRGWYGYDWLWWLRGVMDRLVGGVGLRRGRSHLTRLRPGDVLDFWRVLLADKPKGQLLLYAEMKLPGEAWLEFHVDEKEVLVRATFRPRGVFGRLYWYLSYPFHIFIFPNLARQIAYAGKA